MRICVDDALISILDEIRDSEWRIAGKGHSDTVRFLTNYYRQRKAVEKIVEEGLSKIPGIIEASFRAALKTAIVNLLKET